MLGGLAKTELNGSGSGYECGCSSADVGWPYYTIRICWPPCGSNSNIMGIYYFYLTFPHMS